MFEFTLCFESEMPLYRRISCDFFAFKFTPRRPDFSNGKLKKTYY